MQKIIFFTAGPKATAEELADIAKLNAAASAPYEVAVMNGAGANYGDGRLAPCDFVAGTVPTAYNAKPTVDPDAMPVLGLTDTQAVIEDGQEIAGTGGTFAPVIVDGEITGGTWTPD